MPKASKFSNYFNGNSKDRTQKTPEPKVHINEAMLKVMGQAAVEMYQYFANQNLEDVPIPNAQE